MVAFPQTFRGFGDPNASGVVAFTDDFNGADLAAMNPAKWQDVSASGGGAFIGLYQNRVWLQGSAAGYAVAAQAKSIMSSVSNFELLFSFRYDSSGDEEIYGVTAFRADGYKDANPLVGFGGPMNGYYLNMQSASDSIILQKNIAGVGSTIGTMSFAQSLATLYKCRVRCVGTSIKVRLWLASGSEPGTWNGDYTDASHASGIVLLGFIGGNNAKTCSVQWDDMSVTTV